MENDIECIQKLSNILFVDDRETNILSYQKMLKRAGKHIVTKYADSLQQALDMLKPVNVNKPPFDMILIDLHMPPLPPALVKYSTEIQYKLNEGQTLGLWLDKKYPDMPYAYLTVVPDAIDDRSGSQAHIGVINKNTVLPRDIVQELCLALKKWEKWRNISRHGND